MSSIDDIDDEVIAAPVQTLSRWARKKQERDIQIENEKIQQQQQIQINMNNNGISNSNVINSIGLDGNNGQLSTTSSLFSRLKKKLESHKNILPRSYDEKIPPLPIAELDITKPFYGITIQLTCTELELELIRLVSFYRASIGPGFDRVLHRRLRRRQDDQDNGIRFHDVSLNKLGFLQIKHPLYPLMIQYTHIYKHILNTMKNTDEILSNLLLKKSFENIEKFNNENGNENDGNDQEDDKSKKKKKIDDNDNESTDKSKSSIMTDDIAPFSSSSTTSTTTTSPQAIPPTSIHPDRQNLLSQAINTNNLDDQSESLSSPYLSKQMAYEEKIISNMPKPPKNLISHILTTPKQILTYLTLHAKHIYRNTLILLHDKMVEQLEWEALAEINWRNFFIKELVTLNNTQEDDLLLPLPCTSIQDLKSLFSDQELREKTRLQRETDEINEILSKRKMADIDDIDDTIDSYMVSSRSGLTGIAASHGSSGGDMGNEQFTGGPSGGIKRSRRDFSGNGGDDEDLDIVTFSGGVNLLSTPSSTINNNNGGSNSKIMTAKCEICGQNIPINELAEHMKLELSNPDYFRKNNQVKGEDSGGMKIDHQRALLLGLDSTNVIHHSNSQLLGNNAAAFATPGGGPHVITSQLTPSGIIPTQPSKQQQQQQSQPVYTAQYMAQKHSEFLQQSHHNTSVPLPPGLNQQSGTGGGVNFAPPLPPGSFPQGIGDKRQYNHPHGPLVSLHPTQSSGQQQYIGGGYQNPNDPMTFQQPQQSQQNITIELIDITHNKSKCININYNQLVILEDEKPLVIGSMAPLNWEHTCLYEDGLQFHEIKLKIPNLTTSSTTNDINDQEFGQKYNFRGQDIIIKTPTLRLSVGEFKKLIQNEILNNFDSRIKLNTTIDSPKPNIFLNNDLASLAAYQLKHGYTLAVSLQKYVRKR